MPASLPCSWGWSEAKQRVPKPETVVSAGGWGCTGVVSGGAPNCCFSSTEKSPSAALDSPFCQGWAGLWHTVCTQGGDTPFLGGGHSAGSLRSLSRPEKASTLHSARVSSALPRHSPDVTSLVPHHRLWWQALLLKSVFLVGIL